MFMPRYSGNHRIYISGFCCIFFQIMKSRATLLEKDNAPDLIRASDPNRSMASINELSDYTETARYNVSDKRRFLRLCRNYSFHSVYIFHHYENEYFIKRTLFRYFMFRKSSTFSSHITGKPAGNTDKKDSVNPCEKSNMERDLLWERSIQVKKTMILTKGLLRVHILSYSNNTLCPLKKKVGFENLSIQFYLLIFAVA